MLRFRRLGSSTLFLGEALDSSTGHLGDALLVLPSQTPMPPSVMSLQEAWDFQHPSLGAGYLLFLEQGHDLSNLSSDQVTGMAARLHSLLPRVVREQHLSLGWVRGNPQTPSTVQVQILAMVRAGGGVRTQNIPQAIRFQQIELMVLPGTPFRLLSDSSGFELENTEYLAPPGADPRMDQPTKRRVYLRGAAAYDIDKVGERITIPLMGGDRGSLQFDVSGLNADDMDAGTLDTALYYVVPEPDMGRDQSLRYPLFNLGNPEGAAGPVREVGMRARLFPANLLRSIFDFGGQNGSDGPVLQSYFGTYHGHPVYMIPQAGAGLVFTHVPNPGVYPSRSAEVRTHFGLIPSGNFELTVNNPTDELEWLRGGSSGSEFVSFRPKGPAGHGDVLCFFPGQNGYAPSFDQLTAHLQQTNGDLLTDRFTTSWMNVGHHPLGPNGHKNQYYAQPDDNVLHTHVGTDFLSSFEVAAADLPELTHSNGDAWGAFPMTPLNGVAAPDDRISRAIGMHKYVIFEKEIMSPTRKNRISSVKTTSIATYQGRSLFSSHTSTTTPQGMLVDVAGNDWSRLRLAYDDVQYLAFGDITDELQDALNTNRLFLVASEAGTLDQGTTEDKVEIAGWPFRVQVGQRPPGAPAVTTGLARYQNVMIFKFVDETFDDMIEDLSLWADPASFNGNVADVQTWLQEFIEDARAKASDPESSELYTPLVDDVLDNANWTGIVVFNVTVPPSEMPCEVQGLMGGIRYIDDFKAHHLGFAISNVNATATAIEKSSIFALIDYEDNDDPTGGDDFTDYEFIVRTIKARFANSEIADFSSLISLKVKRAFDERIANPEPITGPGQNVTIDTLEVEGSYQVFNEVPTYTFETIAEHDPMKFAPTLHGTDTRMSLIETMTITKVQFATSSCLGPNAGPDDRVVGTFSLRGSLKFRSGASFDFFSFEKLPFNDLTISMSFGFDADGRPIRPKTSSVPSDFTFDPGNLRFEVSAAGTRNGSLMSLFPLQLKSFMYATQKIDIEQLGYWKIPAFIPGWVEAENPKYALAFTIDMGPLNSPTAKKKVKGAIDIIAAWEPSGDGEGVDFGVKLGEGSDGGKEFGIEGVLTLGVDNYGFLKIPENPGPNDPFVYAFFIRAAFLKIMKVQIPPGGDFSLMLFVPYKNSTTVNLDNLGWFVAYNRSEGGGGGSAPSVGTAIESVDVSANQININGEIEITVKVKNEGIVGSNPQAVVSVKADAVEPSGNKPLPPAPQTRTLSFTTVGQDLEAKFTWPGKVAGTYTFRATAKVLGDLTPGNNEKSIDGVVTVLPANDQGKKEKKTVLKLDYLGLGHRVNLPTPDLQLNDLNTVEDVINVMRNQLVPNQSGTALQEQLMKVYSPDSGVLIGIDITILEVFRFAFVFAQTNEIYGALIGFVDKAPGFLKGFQFQILYKKLSDDLGVYQTQLKLPDKFRQFELGAASITIPVIGIDIYTNGDFRFNFGFPYNSDFSNSFCIQMMAGPVPIIGYAGFYFAKLSGATSTLVPALPEWTAARWDPVLEFGIGLKLGIGKSIDKGPLKAGFSVSIVVILEGALAWLKLPPPPIGPDADSSLGDPPDWFRIKGKAGLVVQLYGILDFGIVKLGLEVTASAMFTFLYEKYKDIVLGVELSVSVKVTLIIGGFKIFGKTVSIELSFSFAANLAFTFTIASPEPIADAPWMNLPDDPDAIRAPLAALQQVIPTPIAWESAEVMTPEVLPLLFVPHMIVADDAGVPRAHMVATLMMSQTAFDGLLERLLRWTIQLDLPGTNPDITRADLERIDERLNVPRTLGHSGQDHPLDFSEIMTFLEDNYLRVEVRTPDDNTSAALTAFPMLPGLSMTVSGQSDAAGSVVVDFATENEQPESYQVDVAEYFNQLAVDVEYKSGIFIDPNRHLQDNHDPQLSMATMVFQDYFAFLIKAGIDRAVQRLQGSESPVTLNGLMADMGSDFVTVSRMAARTFFAGLRLPRSFGSDPDYTALSATAEPLYALTGQQVPVRFIENDVEDEPDYEDWTLTLSVTSVPSDPDESLIQTIEVDEDDGDVFVTSGLTMTIAGDDNGEHASVADLEDWQPTLGSMSVSPVQRLRSRPRDYSFKNPTNLERQEGDDGSPTYTGEATVFPISDALLQQLGDHANLSVELKNDDGAVPVLSGDGQNASWALRVDFSASRVERTEAVTTSEDESAVEVQYIPNTYGIGGTNERTRNLIGRVLSRETPGVTGFRLYYEVEGKVNALVRQVPGTADGAGSNVNAGPDIVLMKTNLSTVSAPQEGPTLQAVHPASDDYSAAMIASQAGDFLRLIWEASIVNAPGYFLYYDNEASSGSTELPEEAFQGRVNEANLTLFVLFGSTNDATDSLLVDVANASATYEDMYVETPTILEWHPAIAPGAVGFEFLRSNPLAAGFNGSSLGLEPLFNLMSYSIVADAAGSTGFDASIRGLPVGPTGTDPGADEPVDWTYRQGIKVFPFARNGGGNLYAGTGQTVTIGFQFLDIYGNVLDPGTATIPQLAAPVRYSDRLFGVSQWPGVSTGYEFSTGGNLTVSVIFAREVYSGLNAEELQNAQSALDIYYLIQDQLNGPGVSANLASTVAPARSEGALAALQSLVDDAIDYLESLSTSAGAAGMDEPIVRTITISSISSTDRAAQSPNMFPMLVHLDVMRGEGYYDLNDAERMPELWRARTSVPPVPVIDEGFEPIDYDNELVRGQQKSALEVLATNFETAFPELKMATGHGPEGPRTLWAVRLAASEGLGITYSIGSTPGYYAPAPLSNSLEQRNNVPIRPNGPPTGGEDEVPELINVSNVDMDHLGLRLLEEIDRFLGPEMAPAARKINPAGYLKIISAKSKIAEGIAAGVTNVLEEGLSDPGGHYVNAAREVYRQGALVRLATAYDVETAVVLPVTTSNSDTANGTRPRLYGPVSGTNVGQNPDADAGFSFSNAKIDLEGGSPATPPSFAVLFDSDRTRDQASALVNMQYSVTHVEHQIEAPSDAGYESSSWLTLLRPVQGSAMGPFDIPIPLREYPTPPALTGQKARPVDPDTVQSLSQATRWQYEYTFQQVAVAQDTVIANVVFNAGLEVPNALSSHGLDLLDWLVRFDYEYPQIAGTLAQLRLGIKNITDTEGVSNAIGWFANLVEGAGDTWWLWTTGASGTRDLLQTSLEAYKWEYNYTERLASGNMVVEIDRSPSTAAFPLVEVTLEDGETKSLLSPSASGNRASYSFPWSAGELPDMRSRMLAFRDLDVLHTENAWGGIHVSRNLNLTYPERTPRTTNEKFVYKTPLVRVVNKVTPLIDNKNPIEMNPGQVQNLAAQIDTLLRDLFDSAVTQSDARERLLKVGVRYAYDVRGQAGPAIGPGQLDEFQAYMPVTQVMPYELAPNNMGGFVNGLATAIEAWMNQTNPIRSRGFYEFDLSVFAALSDTDLPVLRLRRLWIGLERIQ